MGTRIRDLLRHTTAGRCQALLAAGLVLALAPAATALAADSLSLSISPAQPTDAGNVEIAAQGTAAGDVLHVHYLPATAGGCASDPTQTGSGTPVSPNLTAVGPGSFDVQGAPQSVAFGSYLLCGWLTDPSDAATVLAPVAQLPFTVDAADTLALASPADAVAGQPFDLAASGAAYDSGAVVDATYKPAGGSCAPTPNADAGTPTDATGVGAGTGQYTVTPMSEQTLNAGSYLICAWLVDPRYPTPLTATSQLITVHPPQASLRLVTPARVDSGEYFTLALRADVSAGVPLLAVADIKPATATSTCAANPAGEPDVAIPELDTQFTRAQAPAGTVTETNIDAYAPSFGTYLLCGWLLEGWTGARNPPTVAGPVATTVTALPPEIFGGYTSQRLRIVIAMAPVERLVLAVDYSDRLRCRRPVTYRSGQRWNGIYTNRLSQGTFGTVRIGAAGRFHSYLNGNRNHTLQLAGVLSGKRIRGTFSEQGKAFAFTDDSHLRSACRTGTVRYTVTRS